MQRFIAGTCQMHLRLTTQGPWMVRGDVREENDHQVTYPMRDPVEGYPFVPASSLKGVFRNTAERILRSMASIHSDTLPPLADIPFVHTVPPQPDREEKRKALLRSLPRNVVSDSELEEWTKLVNGELPPTFDPDQVYTQLSPASQLFGCTLHAGLVTLTDARPEQPDRVHLAERSHVAIDRFAGGVGQGPYTEKLGPGKTQLKTTLTITNFALWHIGLLALVFQEINQGYVNIGAGTRKGQGQVRVDVDLIEFRYNRQVYGDRTTGIISAQAALKQWLSHENWHTPVEDVPVVVERENEPLMGGELEADDDWRSAGTVKLTVREEDEIQFLFMDAVMNVWRPWIEQMRQERS